MKKNIPCHKKKNPQAHRWKLSDHKSRTSKGVCSKCGYTGDELGREFINVDDFSKPRIINGASRFIPITNKFKKIAHDYMKGIINDWITNNNKWQYATLT